MRRLAIAMIIQFCAQQHRRLSTRSRVAIINGVDSSGMIPANVPFTTFRRGVEEMHSDKQRTQGIQEPSLQSVRWKKLMGGCLLVHISVCVFFLSTNVFFIPLLLACGTCTTQEVQWALF